MDSIFELGWFTVGSPSKKTMSLCGEIVVMYVTPVVHIICNYIGMVLGTWNGRCLLSGRVSMLKAVIGFSLGRVPYEFV